MQIAWNTDITMPDCQKKKPSTNTKHLAILRSKCTPLTTSLRVYGGKKWTHRKSVFLLVGVGILPFVKQIVFTSMWCKHRRGEFFLKLPQCLPTRKFHIIGQDLNKLTKWSLGNTNKVRGSGTPSKQLSFCGFPVCLFAWFLFGREVVFFAFGEKCCVA